MQPISATVGPLTTANNQAVAAVQTPAAAGALTLTATPVVLDKPRQLVITSAGNDSSVIFVVTGTTYGGIPASESITGSNAGTVVSVLNYLTVSSVVASAKPVGAVEVGTTTVAGSRWVRLDSWANNNVGLQTDVTGTVSYTVQYTFDDPDDANYSLGLSNVNWFNSTDTNVVNASASKTSSFTFAPTYARVVLNSGTGSVRAVFAQYGSVSY
jgi:hypothetical protein